MGEKLRNILGFYWTEKERKEYLSKRKKELGPIYMDADIPLEEPWNRARYLDIKLNIEDGETQETFLEIERIQGKSYALIALEEEAIKKYF